MANTPDSYTSQASQYVKEVYAPKVVRLYPEANFLMKNIPFNAANRVGKQYVVPVELAPEQGVTYAAAGAGAFSLNGAQALSTQDATIQPAQIVVERALDYESIQRTVGSKAAFVSFIDATLRSVVALATKRQEASMMHGQSTTGIGVISAITVAASGTAVNSTLTASITDAEWSGGLWGGLENALVDVWSNTSTRRTTALNIVVSAVNLTSKTVTLKVQNSTDANFTAVAAGDILAFGQSGSTLGASEMVGLHAICSNSGTLFGISGATYGLWAGNSLTSWGTPSLGKILDAVSRLVERGLDEDVVFLCSPKHFARLNSDQTALRMYGDAGGTAKQGWGSIKLASENGSVFIRSHRFCKDGYAFLLPMSKFMRIGSTELTFTNMGVDGDIFLQTSGTASVQLRGYLGQALLCTAPGRTALISGVTYP